jgi:phage recombination protein Bet
MNSLVKQNQAVAFSIPEGELIEVLRNSLYPGAKIESVKLVLGYCKARGIDPMKKPVHIVPLWNKELRSLVDVLMPGVNSYRTDAARTGEYVGKSEPEFGPEMVMDLGGVQTKFPVWCKVTVKRLIQGKEYDFVAKEFWLENYATAKADTAAPNAMWRRRPYGQLAKCAESQALRMAFPEETGGGNTAEEMEGKSFSGPTIDAEPVPVEPPAKPAEAEIVDLNADPLRDKVNWIVRKLARVETELQFEALDASVPRLMAAIEAAERGDKPMLIKMVEGALESKRATFVKSAPLAVEEPPVWDQPSDPS